MTLNNSHLLQKRTSKTQSAVCHSFEAFPCLQRDFLQILFALSSVSTRKKQIFSVYFTDLKL